MAYTVDPRDDPTFDSGNLFSQLNPCSWRGIVFPIAHMHTRIEHDHAIHARPDRDGARIEATGRKPLVFSCRAFFRNGVSSGGRSFAASGAAAGSTANREKFGLLYPYAHRAMLAACADRAAGELIHPGLGKINARVVRCESVLSAERRDGEDLDIEWVEDDTGATAEGIFAAPPPISQAVSHAQDVDNAFQALNPKPSKYVVEKPFVDFLTAIKGAFDQSSLLSKQAGGQIDHVLYRLDALQFAVEQNANVQDWPVTNACERLRSSLQTLKLQQLAKTKDVAIFITPKAATVASIASTLAANVGDVITLNPSLANFSTVPAQTAVRYYRTG